MTWLRKKKNRQKYKLLTSACEKRALNNLKSLSPAFSGGRIVEMNLHLLTERSTVQCIC